MWRQLFTSLSLSNSLLTQSKIHYLGTLRKNRREIPKCAKEIKGLPNYSSRFFYTGGRKASLISYITKKNKYVLLMSNMHFSKFIPLNSPKLKPDIILEYNANKSGVDKLDHSLKEFRIYRAIRRWPAVLFFDLLGFITFASWIIFTIKFPDDQLVMSKNRREFLYLLGKELVAPQIEIRLTAPKSNHLHHSLKKCIKSNLPVSSASVSVELEITDEDQVNPVVEPSSSIIPKKIPKRRNHQCPRKHDRKFGTVCHLCNLNVCNEHSTQFLICTSCSEAL